jgi:hypothetical protein
MTSYPRPRLYPTRSVFAPLIDIWPTTDKMRWFSQSLVWSGKFKGGAAPECEVADNPFSGNN